MPDKEVLLTGKNVSKEDFNEYELRLENVSFRYEKGEEDIFTHVDLTIKPVPADLQLKCWHSEVRFRF